MIQCMKMCLKAKLKDWLIGLVADEVELLIHRTVVEMRDKLDELDEANRNMKEALGSAIWRSKSGHARWTTLLSTEHLENIMEFSRVSLHTRVCVQAELERRRIDHDWRKKDPLGEMRMLLKKKPKRRRKS